MEQVQQIELKQSGLGIASFVVSIITALSMLCVVFGGAMMMQTSAAGSMQDAQTLTMMVGFLVIVLIVVGVVALGLGVGALFQKNRKRVFAVLGVVISLLVLCGTIVLMIIGNSVPG